MIQKQHNVPDVLREHVKRIRILEANNLVADGDWAYASGTFTNNWVDNTLVNVLSAEPAVSYLRTASGWAAVRGRVSEGDEGKSAFLLPASFRPPHNMWFTGDVSNGGIPAGFPFEQYFVPGLVGRVLVRTNGEVVPYLGGAGFGSYASSTLLDPFTAAAGPLVPNIWVNGFGAPYAYIGAGGFGRSGAGGDTGALYLGTDLFADSEVSVRIGSTIPDRIQLGLRCQYPSTDPTLLSYPPGFWLNIDIGSGADLSIFTQTVSGVIDFATFNAGSTPVFTNPTWAALDRLSFAINGTHFTVSRNGVVIFQAQVGIQHTPTFAAGLFGLGAQGGNGVQLVKDFYGGIQRNGPGDHTLGVSLDQIFFKTTD